MKDNTVVVILLVVVLLAVFAALGLGWISLDKLKSGKTEDKKDEKPVEPATPAQPTGLRSDETICNTVGVRAHRYVIDVESLWAFLPFDGTTRITEANKHATIALFKHQVNKIPTMGKEIYYERFGTDEIWLQVRLGDNLDTPLRSFLDESDVKYKKTCLDTYSGQWYRRFDIPSPPPPRPPFIPSPAPPYIPPTIPPRNPRDRPPLPPPTV